MMKQSQHSQRIEKLRELINEYRYHYHVLNESIMSEGAADSLKHELAQLEEAHPELITADSPTQRVAGIALEKFKKIQHRVPMISLNDVFDESEVKAWITRMEKILPASKHEFFCDIKMDGLACALVYENGLLSQAVTRGDSRTGEDVTLNVRTIQNVPLRLRGNGMLNTGRTEVRGEIVMLKDDFTKLNEKRQSQNIPTFKNPRNLAAGTIRQLDPKLVAERPLTFIGYDMLREDEDELSTNSYVYDQLQHIGIETSGKQRYFKELHEVMEYVHELDNTRATLPFNTDGLVIKVNSREHYRKLGTVGKSPRGAVAYKYAAEEATTIVRDIVISIGRTGVATPVAVFDPVDVAGTTVQHASLHNADEIQRKDVRVGDTVIIYKAGDIIPQVERVLIELRPSTAKTFDYDKELKRQFPELAFERSGKDVAYRIKGASGPLLLKRALQHFASRSALDIDTLGEKNVVALVDSGLVKDFADLYTLEKAQLIELERFADISAQKLIDAIAQKKEPELERFVYALGIRHVGTQTAIDLVNHFGSLETLSSARIDELESIDGIGTVVAESIVAWFADTDNQKLLHKFSEVGVRPRYIKKTGKFIGLSFVVTGTLESMSRDEAAEKIRNEGGIFQSSVAKDTDYLVAGGKVGTSKLKKAEQYGTKIVSEQQFLDLL